MRQIGSVCLLALSILMLGSLGTTAQSAPDRIALLVGNAGYSRSPLKNPRNDVNLLRRTLQRAGFSVQALYDASNEEMGQAIEAFARRARYAKAALFYFSGHGTQHEGENYLIPIRRSVRGPIMDTYLKYRTQSLSKIIDLMQRDGNSSRVNLVIIDACRTPVQRSTRSAPSGLAPPSGVKAGTLIAFATAPNTPALDGHYGNSPYAAELAGNMLRPGLPVEQVFKQTRIGVIQRTGRRQTPWENSSLTVDFYFLGQGARPSRPSRPSVRPRPQTSNSGDLVQQAKAFYTQVLTDYNARNTRYFDSWQYPIPCFYEYSPYSRWQMRNKRGKRFNGTGFSKFETLGLTVIGQSWNQVNFLERHKMSGRPPARRLIAVKKISGQWKVIAETQKYDKYGRELFINPPHYRGSRCFPYLR